MRLRPLGIVPLALLAACGLLSPFEAGPATLEEPSLFAAGAKVSCPVTNGGASNATARVQFTLTLPDGSVLTGEDQATLGAGERKVVTHTFEGLRVKDRNATAVSCRAGR